MFIELIYIFTFCLSIVYIQHSSTPSLLFSMIVRGLLSFSKKHYEKFYLKKIIGPLISMKYNPE